jgi:hypothetical protein
MNNVWLSKGMTKYPSNHINKSSIGFDNNKPNLIINYFRKIFKKTSNPIVKKHLEILRNESQ